MKKIIIKILFSLIITGFLILPVSVFGAITYERNPTGYYITSPVSISTSWTDEITGDYWGISFYIKGEGTIRTNCISSSIKSNTFIKDISIGYIAEAVYIYDDWSADCEGAPVNRELLEGYLGSPGIFEIIETPPPPPTPAKLFTMPEGAISSTTAYIGNLINGMGFIPWLFAGLPLAFLVIKKIILIMPK